MSLKAMHDNNVNITAKQDANVYNALSGQDDYVISGVGDEMKVTTVGLLATLQKGQAVIQGRHVTSDTPLTTLNIPDNSSGYIVLRIDLTQAIGNEAKLIVTSVLEKQDLRNTGLKRDLLLYSFTSTASLVTLTDRRVFKINPLDYVDSHQIKTSSVHGSTNTPTASRIPQYDTGGRLKGNTPVASNDLVPLSYYQNAANITSGKFSAERIPHFVVGSNYFVVKSVEKPASNHAEIYMYDSGAFEFRKVASDDIFTKLGGFTTIGQAYALADATATNHLARLGQVTNSRHKDAVKKTGTGQSINSSSTDGTTVNFPTVEIESDYGVFTHSNNSITVNYDGVYEIASHILFSLNPAPTILFSALLTLYVNDKSVKVVRVANPSGITVSSVDFSSELFNLEKGDIISFKFQQDSGKVASLDNRFCHIQVRPQRIS